MKVKIAFRPINFHVPQHAQAARAQVSPLALGEIKDQRVVEPLIEILERPTVSKLIAHALGEIGDERAV